MGSLASGGSIPSIQQINASQSSPHSRPRRGVQEPPEYRHQHSSPQHLHGVSSKPRRHSPPSAKKQQINVTVNINGNHSNKGGGGRMSSEQPADTEMPPFDSHMTLQDASKLSVHKKIDHRDQVGRFVFATVSEKQGTSLKIHYDGWSRKWDTWSDFNAEIHRFAVAGSISKRPAHRFGHLKKGDFIDINPTQRHPGWKCGEIRRLDQKSGQVQVVYESMDKNYLYWAHLDNAAEIAEFTSKSGTVHATQVELQSGLKGDGAGGGGHGMQQSGSSSKSQRSQPMEMSPDSGQRMGGGHRAQSSAVGMGAAPMDELEAFQRIRAKRFPRSPNERIENKYGIGDWLEVQDTQTMHWITATVIDRENNWIVVHFDGWPSKYDQKIHAVKHRKRLRDLGSGLQETQEEKDIKQEMTAFLKEVEAMGWFLEKVDADGNCLYRCFATQIYGDSNKQKMVRAECCRYMRANEQFFRNFIPDFAVRMKEKEQEYEWGDHVDITALSELYNVRVRVFEYDPENEELYMSFDQGEHHDTVTLPLVLLARHRKKHYNIINDPKAVFKRPLQTAAHRDQQAKLGGTSFVSLREHRLNEDAKAEEHGDDEKDTGNDHTDDEHDIDNASLVHSKSMSRHNSNHNESPYNVHHSNSEKKRAFSLFLSDEEFGAVLSRYNISGPLCSDDLRSIFSPLMTKLHKKIEFQWESNHREVNKQILDRFWRPMGEHQEQRKNCEKWTNSLREKIPSGEYPVDTANTTFNQVIVSPMSQSLGYIVKTRKRQSTIDPFRAQQAAATTVHHRADDKQQAMDLDDE